MYILDFLKNPLPTNNMVTFDYRLLCSGVLYNCDVVTADWTKSDASRILFFEPPFTLRVCSYPFDEYPQELALQFCAPFVHETKGATTTGFYPDEDIARDLTALLTLFCHRLITVATKIHEHHPKHYDNELLIFRDLPIGFVKSLKPVHWVRQPVSFVYGGPDGITEIKDNNPAPLGVGPNQIKKLLLSLPQLSFATSVVQSARLYSLALQQIRSDVDVAYQLLVAAIEVMANEVLDNFKPNVGDMVFTQSSVERLATEFGLNAEQSCALAVEACKREQWISRKFKKFILDNITDEPWREDDLFKLPSQYFPNKNEFEKALSDIYDARSQLLHHGRSFPPGAQMGISYRVPFRVGMECFDPSSKRFPPVVWFERVVNCAINNFIEASIRDAAVQSAI